ncbi:MAG: metal-dependent transcriptional regulator [bacterium]
MKLLSSNIEDYLETITIISNKNNIVRVKDISKEMGVSMPSVNKAIKILSKEKLVSHENYGYVELTEKGRILGNTIYNSHNVLIKFLTEVLNVDYKIAQKDACKIEHNISDETLNRLIAFLKYIETFVSNKKINWIKDFNHFYKTYKTDKSLKKCKLERNLK